MDLEPLFPMMLSKPPPGQLTIPTVRTMKCSLARASPASPATFRRIGERMDLVAIEVR